MAARSSPDVNTGGIDVEAAENARGTFAERSVPSRTTWSMHVRPTSSRCSVPGHGGNVRRGNLYPLCVGRRTRAAGTDRGGSSARQLGTDVVAHGSTAAGNDQVRFDGRGCGRLLPNSRSSRRCGQAFKRPEQLEYLQERKLPVAPAVGAAYPSIAACGA